MALHEIEFLSANERDTIHAWVYRPVTAPTAIVHIIHGLGEHSRRYMRLIAALVDEGFVVVAGDHAGHGKTAMVSGVWGDAGDRADQVVVEDEKTLQKRVRELEPSLPYIVFGHSWGSMIARAMASGAADSIDGLILGGIAAQMKGIESTIDRAALAALPDPAAEVPVEFVGQLFDGFVDRFGPDAGGTDWVARDADVVRDHSVDPFNNFGAPMSVRFVRGFVDLYDAVNDASWYETVRTDMPVLILAGDQDPVANYGEGAYRVANALTGSGHDDVVTRVYSGFRHEVHNEPPIRDEVAAEIIGWVRRCS